MPQKTITLNPGESQIVGFEFVPTDARTYRVTVDGLTGSFTATLWGSLRTRDEICAAWLAWPGSQDPLAYGNALVSFMQTYGVDPRAFQCGVPTPVLTWEILDSLAIPPPGPVTPLGPWTPPGPQSLFPVTVRAVTIGGVLYWQLQDGRVVLHTDIQSWL